MIVGQVVRVRTGVLEFEHEDCQGYVIATTPRGWPVVAFVTEFYVTEQGKLAGDVVVVALNPCALESVGQPLTGARPTRRRARLIAALAFAVGVLVLVLLTWIPFPL